MKKSLFCFLLGMVLLLVIFPSGTPAEDYRIAGQDLLRISVYEHPDLATEVRVGEDGAFSFPLLGEIQAKGYSTRQLEQSIARQLADRQLVVDPQVSVFVLQYRGQRITVIGEVVKPGQYEITGPTTLLDAISLVNGLGPNAGYQVTVFRKDATAVAGQGTGTLVVDLDRLLNGGDMSQNLSLHNGDLLYVPRAVFYIYGEVNHSGAYRLEKGLTVKRAIALAGGLTAKGSQRRIEITRRDADRERVQGAAIDDPVQGDDVIMVKESLF